MYYADSNILSILLAVITLAAGIYSSSAKRKKGDEDIAQPGSIEDTDDNLSFESIFAHTEDKLSAQPKAQPKVEHQVQPKADAAQAELFEEAVPATGVQAQEPVGKEKSNDVKSRLKSSPKDAVLFAEILKPKYKEF